MVDGKKAGFNEVHATSFFDSSACDSSNCYRDCTALCCLADEIV